MAAIVTKDSLKTMLENSNKEFVARVVGKALVHIFNRQTESEKADSATKVDNGIGFTGADAFSGTMTAKYFLKHNKLESWQVDKWLKQDKKGYPRLCKYHKQINEEAAKKATRPVQLSLLG